MYTASTWYRATMPRVIASARDSWYAGVPKSSALSIEATSRPAPFPDPWPSGSQTRGVAVRYSRRAAGTLFWSCTAAHGFSPWPEVRWASSTMTRSHAASPAACAATSVRSDAYVPTTRASPSP